MKRFLVFILVIMVFPCSGLKAQDYFENFLLAGPQDANKLAEGYIKPVLTSAAIGVNQGWYNTAKPHESLGFDLTFTTSCVFVNDDELLYQPNNLNLQAVTLVNPVNGQAPTIYGPSLKPRYAYKADPSIEFNGPDGLNPPKLFGKHIFPVPIANIGIGIIKNTDLKIRWLPRLAFQNNSVSMFGLGIMHDFKQHIPAINNLPFDLSVFGAYTKFDIQTDLSSSTFSGSEQKGFYNINSWTLQALISKEISVLTVYGGFGFNSAKSAFKMTGTYTVTGTPVGTVSYTDPIKISVDSSGPRFNVGARLKLAVITLHADYTIQKKNVFTAGFGINVK